MVFSPPFYWYTTHWLFKWLDIEYWEQSLDIIYFAKASDLVVHTKLIAKLRPTSYGIIGQLLRWIDHFLSDRCQYEAINGTRPKSHSIRVISGAPQGSVLGPILFCIYVNDVSDIIIGNTACKQFADDIKLYSCVETDGSSSDLDARV